MTKKLQLNFDKDRIEDQVTMDELVDLYDGSLKAMRNVLAKFVVGEDGSFLSYDEGLKVIGSQSLRTIKELSSSLIDSIQNGAVPKENGEE